MPNKLDALKLQTVKAVEDVPRIARGSAIDTLPEFQETTAIIEAVKGGADAAGRKWEIFNGDQILKRQPELKAVKSLMVAFAIKLRRLIEKEGIRSLRVERRKDKLYLVALKEAK